MIDEPSNATRLYEAIRAWQRKHAFPPTHRELMAATGISSTSVVAYNLRLLKERHLIDFLEGEQRTVHLVGTHYAGEGLE